MSHKNNFYSVTINEFLIFQKQAWIFQQLARDAGLQN